MKRLLIVLTLLLLSSSLALTQDITRLGGLGPKALGMGGAFTAVADDGSALYYNLGGLTKTESGFVQSASDIGILRLNSRPAENFLGFSANSSPEFLPILSPLETRVERLTDKLVFGVGFYTTPISTITSAIAFQLTDTLSVGLGIDAGDIDVRSRTDFQVGKKMFDGTSLKLKIRGSGVGYRLGILWEPTDKFAWGLGYSSPMQMKFVGSAKLTILNFTALSDNFRVNYSLPGRINTGIAVRLKKWLFAFDVNYYDYSSSNTIAKFNPSILPTIPIRTTWKNSYSFHFGGERKVGRWSLRGGWGHQTPAIPRNDLNIFFRTNGDTWHASFGLGYESRSNWSLDLAYLYGESSRRAEWWEGIKPGWRNSETHTVSFGITRRF